MKKGTYHIICSWALLFCFIAGQYMVFAHQHYVNRGLHSLVHHGPNCKTQPTFSEKCQVCDSMHHIAMELPSHANYHTLTSTTFVYKTFEYEFTSIALILSPGRAPPVVLS